MDMHPGLRPNVHPQPEPPTESVVARAISHALPAIRHGLPAVRHGLPTGLQDAVGPRWWARPGSPTTLLPSTFCVMAGSGAALDASQGRKRHQDPAGRMTGSVSVAEKNPRTSGPQRCLIALVMAPRWWKRYARSVPIRPW